MQVKNLGFPTNNNSLLNVYYLPTVKHLIILYYYIRWKLLLPYPVQFSSVTQLCPTLCDPMDCSTPGFPVHHQLAELAQTHVHQVSDAIQPSCPLSSPSPPAYNFTKHQGVSNESALRIRCQSIRVSASASVLPMNIQDRFPLGWTSCISLQSKGLARVFSNTTVQKNRFFSTQLSLWSNSHIHI